MNQEDENTFCNVLVNNEGQYTIWPVDHEIPNGWRAEGTSGTQQECVEYIKTVWTDRRLREPRPGPEE